MVRYLLLITALIFSLTASAVTVYTWKDQNGATVYSDEPRPGSTAMQVPTGPAPATPTTPITPPQSIKPPVAPPNASGDDALENEGYESISIVIPQDGDTVRDNSGNMQVTVALKPTLKKGDKVQLLIDGKVAGAQATTNFQITAVERGEHALQAEVVNSAGAVVIKSSSVKFFMHQAHVSASGRISS